MTDSNASAATVTDRPAWLDDLFSAIDAADTERFLAFLTDDATFRFGSAEALVGVDAIRAGVDGFFATIDASRHALGGVWHGPDSLVVEGTVTYTRLDGATLTLPFANVFGMRGERIARYSIYIDIAPLYAE